MRCCIPRRRLSVIKLLLLLLATSGGLFLYHSQLQPGLEQNESSQQPGHQEWRTNIKRDILNLHNYNNSEQKQLAPDDMLLGLAKTSSHSITSSMTTPPVTTRLSPSPMVAVDIGGSDNCDGPWDPICQLKMEWMKEGWKTDPCYAAYGVDGSQCSFLDYLSLVEHHCPPRPGRTRPTPIGTLDMAQVNYELDPLLKLFSDSNKFSWISRRITSLWSLWVDAIKTLQSNTPLKHHKLRIFVHIGALSDKSKFNLAENADHGGPLGELVQWSDLLAVLHLLGHELVLNTESQTLKQNLGDRATGGSCPSRNKEDSYQAIFTDIVGVKQFKSALKARLVHVKCLFRVLDSFGTEPVFNFKGWKPGKYKKQEWGDLGLNPRQFMTMYPHSPDNSFLGFVVGSNKTNSLKPYVKKKMALVYGKELYMWKDRYNYLDILSQHFDIHATIGTTKQKNQEYDESALVPGFVKNHGILSHNELTALLQETKLFIGLGFPYEGPAPLEAIANGCFFLNPRFPTPLNRDNTKFFSNKPTLRALHSQNPYTADFIGSPYVHTVDIDNQNEVQVAVRKIARHEALPPYIPYEYTHEGMIERVAVYLENQDFCEGSQWPPETSLLARMSGEGQSCKDLCHNKGLVCEPGFFTLLNNKEALEKYSGEECSSEVRGNSVHAPSIANGKCSFQQEQLLLSCVGGEEGVARLCPCRAFKRGQVALCSDCGL